MLRLKLKGVGEGGGGGDLTDFFIISKTLKYAREYV